MNIYHIKNAVAAYFNKVVDDLIVNEDDLALVALNQVRLEAEQLFDFGFTRKLLQLDVDGVTGGSLDTAVEYGTDTPVLGVKTVVDVGTFDSDGNFVPAEWTTTADSLNRQRSDSPYAMVRYPTDAQVVCGPNGQRRFTFTGNKMYFFPRTPNTVFTVGLEAYTFSRDWTEPDTATTASDVGDIWLMAGHKYLQWATIVHLNNMYKHFVFRQEGNLPPPEKQVESALVALQLWDVGRYEQFRRHSR